MKSLLKKLAKKIAYSKPVGKFFELGFNAMWRKKYESFRKKYSIDENFRFSGIGINFYGNGEIVGGKNSYIGNFSTVQAYDGCRVEIGEHCAISHNVRIYTANRDANDVINEIEKPGHKTGNVIIGSNTWIGANVFITEGVEIGHHCVIGANSVVTKSIPSNSVAVGCPARVIKQKSNEKDQISSKYEMGKEMNDIEGE